MALEATSALAAGGGSSLVERVAAVLAVQTLARPVAVVTPRVFRVVSAGLATAARTATPSATTTPAEVHGRIVVVVTELLLAGHPAPPPSGE
jgi:hypothetical protein